MVLANFSTIHPSRLLVMLKMTKRRDSDVAHDITSYEPFPERDPEVLPDRAADAAALVSKKVTPSAV